MEHAHKPMRSFTKRSLALTAVILFSFSVCWPKSFAEKVIERMERTMNTSLTPALFSPPPVNQTVSVRVSSSSDDAEEKTSNGDVTLNSSDLELVDDGSTNQIVGMRFNGINVPAGATITNAYLEFETDNDRTGTCNLTIYGQDDDNPSTFYDIYWNISSRAKTSASVDWSPPDWNYVNEIHQSPDLSNIVQEIVDRPGWSSGNSMVMLVVGSGDGKPNHTMGNGMKLLYW